MSIIPIIRILESDANKHGKQVVEKLINGHIIVPPEKAMERAGRCAALRELTDVGFVSHMFMTIVMNIYQRTLQEYRPDEVPRFAQKYVENWRKALLTPIKVRYQQNFVPLE